MGNKISKRNIIKKEDIRVIHNSEIKTRVEWKPKSCEAVNDSGDNLKNYYEDISSLYTNESGSIFNDMIKELNHLIWVNFENEYNQFMEEFKGCDEACKSGGSSER